MSNYEASGANYSLWELESACSTACRHWLSDFLSFFLGWSHLFFPSVPCREKPSERKASEPGCSPRSNQTASLLPNKAVKILFIIILPLSIVPNATDFRDSSLWPILKNYFIYICVLPVVVILFTSQREVKHGQDVLQVLQGALCALWKALYTEYIKLSLSFSHPELQHRILARLTLAWPWGRISGQPCPGTAPRRYPRFISCHPVASPSDR